MDSDTYKRRMLARNPGATPEALSELASDGSRSVCEAVAENPRAPAKALATLASDRRKSTPPQGARLLTEAQRDALIRAMNKRVRQCETKASSAGKGSIAWYEARSARRAFLGAMRDIEAMESERLDDDEE